MIYAYVKNLSGACPKTVVPADDLYEIEGWSYKPFLPKDCTDFSSSKSYGMQVGENMVLHRIGKLSDGTVIHLNLHCITYFIVAIVILLIHLYWSTFQALKKTWKNLSKVVNRKEVYSQLVNRLDQLLCHLASFRRLRRWKTSA